MKKYIVLSACVAGILFTTNLACKGKSTAGAANPPPNSGNPIGTSDQAALRESVIVNFADNVVLPTYITFIAKVEGLNTALIALGTAVGDTDRTNALAQAKAAWIAARVPWEQSETFLFGPVQSNGYDPAMDSWPLNKNDLDGVLASASAFTPSYVATLTEGQKGFHTIEYLIFGASNNKIATQITSREIEYLLAISSEMVANVNNLKTAWTSGVNGKPAFREVFVTAGQQGNTVYVSTTAAIQEIVNAMIAICDEVANGKIAGPYDAKDVNLVESQFSFNSLADFTDNIQGLKNAYLGFVLGASGANGMSALVSKLNVSLDLKVKAQIELSIAALQDIPGPFPTSIRNPAAYPKIESAQEAIRELQRLLEIEVLPLVQTK